MKSPLGRRPQLRLVLELGLAALALALLVPRLLDSLEPESDRVRIWFELALYVLPLLILSVWRLRRLLPKTVGLSLADAWRPQALALSVLLLGLTATGFAVHRINEQTHELAQERFSNQVETLRHELLLRLERPMHALKGLKALYLANNEFRRLGFIRWVGAHDLARDYPGIRGLGFIERVRRDRLDAFIERERLDDAPDFSVRSSGQAPDLYVIKYIEPLNANRAAYGSDVGSEPVRRAGVEAAMRSGQGMRTGPVTLLQGQGEGLGFLMLLPVHDLDAMLDTEENRMASTAGLVYAPVLIRQMMDEISDATGGLLDFDLLDSDPLGRPQTLYSLHHSDGGRDARHVLRVELSLLVANRPLLVRIHANDAFSAAVDLHKTFWLGMAGAGISSSLALVVWLIATGRLRATALAREITTELQSKNQRFALALDGGNDGLWDWVDTHSQAMWWSPQFYRLLGWERGEIEASIAVFDSLLHPEDQARTLAALSAALRDEQAYDVEFRLRHRDGSFRWFRSRAKVFRNEAGEHERMAGSLQDIDQLKTAQADARARSQQMAAMFELSPDAFVSFDREHRARFVSPAFSQLTGLPAPQVLGADCAVLLAELASQDADAQARPLAFELASGPQTIEMPNRRVLELRLHQADEDAEISQLLQLRDVTHQTEVEQMKSEFLSTAAHELRTPMASIYGFTELLMTREMPPERQKTFLTKVHRQCQAMMAILNELLDLARIEARRGKDFDLVRLDLADLAREVAQEFAPAGRDVPILEFEPGEALVNVDRAKLQQVLRNLLSNAYKYSPGGGAVTIGLRREGESLRLSVRDQGIGLTPEQLAHVTERFYRADTSGAIPGTGLGMSIVREIVELHGGRLELQSTPGEGSCFSVLLPALRATHADAASAT